MSAAQVTEAHKALWAQLYNLAHREIFEDFDESSNGPVTQLIADSEAQAAEPFRATIRCLEANELTAAAELDECLAAWIAERDQLRAEVERLKADGAASAFITMSCRASRAETDRNNLRADLDAIKAILNEEKGRAERAEASLHALRLVCGTTDADKFTTWVDRANARAEKAEAELKAERARLDWLESAAATELQSERGWIDRAAIDSGMKEGRK